MTRDETHGIRGLLFLMSHYGISKSYNVSLHHPIKLKCIIKTPSFFNVLHQFTQNDGVPDGWGDTFIGWNRFTFEIAFYIDRTINESQLNDF